MNKLLRIIAKLCLAYCVAIIVIKGWPEMGWLALIGGLCWLGKRGYRRLTTLGSARWADVNDLKRDKMLGGNSGLILGRIGKTLVRLPQAIHTAVFAPTGVGKGVSCVIPFLLTCPESCVVIDFKGENYKLTAEHRKRKFGHRIVVLDPHRMVTMKPDTFNPLDSIGKDSPLAIDECKALANALVVRTGEEREPHFNDSAEAWLTALLATVVQYGER